MIYNESDGVKTQNDAKFLQMLVYGRSTDPTKVYTMTKTNSIFTEVFNDRSNKVELMILWDNTM